MAATTFQSDDCGSVVKSPRSPRNLQAPWSSIVQRPPVMVSVPVSTEKQIGNLTSDWCPPSTLPEIVISPDYSGTEGQASDNRGVGSSNASKKPVWNKPSNGVVEAASPVMGAVSWPALGESTNASPKSSSSESLKALADGPLPPALQVVTVNPNVSATSHDLVAENPLKTSEKPGTADVDSSPRNNAPIESQRGGFGSQSHNVNDNQNQRNSYRRSNSGQHSRLHGSNHHSYGGKRDQDRGNREWNQHSRSFNGRDIHMHPQRGYPSGGYIRPSVHTPPPFIPPQMPLVPSFGNNVMYSDLPSPVFYVQGPPPPPMPPMVGPISPTFYYASLPHMLHATIVSQIDYYFSNENLVKDTYLRKNMDGQGWVPVSLIAGFKKVSSLTNNVELILDAVRASSIVEVQGDKIRRRNDWMRWLMQPAGHYTNMSNSYSQAVGNQDDVASANQDNDVAKTT